MPANSWTAAANGPFAFYRVIPFHLPYLLITCGPGRLWIAHAPMLTIGGAARFHGASG